MSATSTTEQTSTDTGTDLAETEQEQLLEESLVEEVSIDGMCGVY